MSDKPAYYLWWKQLQQDWKGDQRSQREFVVPLDAADLLDARKKAVERLDTLEQTNEQEHQEFSIKIHMAIVYEFKENVTDFFEKDKYARQTDRANRIKREELKRAEAEVERLKKELGEG